MAQNYSWRQGEHGHQPPGDSIHGGAVSGLFKSVSAQADGFVLTPLECKLNPVPSSPLIAWLTQLVTYFRCSPLWDHPPWYLHKQCLRLGCL